MLALITRALAAGGLALMTLGGCGAAETPAPAPAEEAAPPIEFIGEADEEALAETLSDVDAVFRGFLTLRFAVRASDAFRVKPDGTVLTLTALTGDETRLSETFTLAPLDIAAPDSLMQAAGRDGARLTTFQLSGEDEARMAGAVRTLTEMRQDAPGQNELNWSANVKLCREPGAEAPDHVDLTYYVEFDREAGFVQIAPEQRVRRDAFAGTLDFWDACAEN